MEAQISPIKVMAIATTDVAFRNTLILAAPKGFLQLLVLDGHAYGGIPAHAIEPLGPIEAPPRVTHYRFGEAYYHVPVVVEDTIERL